ncbi:unnamed protein product [Auanema sp. JU1783]|nr:unnamed protein product [Auanema sp. JU1783]
MGKACGFKWILLLFFTFIFIDGSASIAKVSINETELSQCVSLNPFQYKCDPPEISLETQQASSCQPDNSVIVVCETVPGLSCIGQLNGTQIFTRKIPNSCFYDAHVPHSTALLLSIFLGFFGLDRIYLGYYAIGLFKMFSLGGLFIIWITDVVLIALQILLPSDGTNYYMPYYGPRSIPVRFDAHSTNYSIYSCADCP